MSWRDALADSLELCPSCDADTAVTVGTRWMELVERAAYQLRVPVPKDIVVFGSTAQGLRSHSSDYDYAVGLSDLYLAIDYFNLIGQSGVESKSFHLDESEAHFCIQETNSTIKAKMLVNGCVVETSLLLHGEDEVCFRECTLHLKSGFMLVPTSG